MGISQQEREAWRAAIKATEVVIESLATIESLLRTHRQGDPDAIAKLRESATRLEEEIRDEFSFAL